nr:control protein E3 7k [Human mastadenovirus C]
MTESLDLELDGINTEQRLLERRKAASEQERLKQEVEDMVNLHQCKRGIFCVVKQAKLTYEKTTTGNRLSYKLPTQRQKLVLMVGEKPITVTQHSAETEGCLHFPYQGPEDLCTLIKTMCGIRDLIPFN